MVPPQHPARDAICTIPMKAEEELKEYSRKRTDDGTGKQYIEFLGLRLFLHPEKDSSGWKVEVESVLPQALQFWDHHKGIRRGDVLTFLDGRDVANLDGAMLEKFLFANRSAKGLRQLVFRRSPLNHLRWMREGPVAGPWDAGEPKVLSGLQRLAEDLRAEEERRRVMEQQTLLAQELAARLALSQESEREYVKAEAELYAAKNLREEKEDRMEALVEKMARATEETALEKLASEHEVHMAEMKAEAETFKRKQESGLQDFLAVRVKELEAMEEQDKVRERQMSDAIAQAERRLRQRLHQSELMKQEENQQMDDAVEQEKLLEAQRRRLRNLSDKLNDLELQQKQLSDKEDKMRLDLMDRQEQVLRKRQEQQLRQCQVQLQDMRSQQETSDQQFRSKLERVHRDLQLKAGQVQDLQEQLLLAYELAASAGKEDPLQQRLIEKKTEEIEKDILKIREDLLQQSQSMEQQEQLVRDQEEQLSQLQEQVLHEIEEQLEKPSERGPDSQELPDSRALRKKLQINREEVAKQISAHKQQQSIRAEQQQQTIDQLGSQLNVLLDRLEQIRAKPVMKLSGRKGLQAEVLSTVRERQEWMEQLQETEIKQEQLYFEERKRLERYEETAEHWKLEQQALPKRQEMAEAAAREDKLREQQMSDAIIQAERHLRQQLHQSELVKREESQQMQDAIEQEKLVEAQQRRLRDLSDKLKDLELQQSSLADKEDKMRLHIMDRQEQVLRKRQEQQLRQCQVQLQDMRSQQETSDQQFRSKLERVHRDLQLKARQVQDLQEQLLQAYELAASAGKEDPLQQRLIEKKTGEIEKDILKIREDLLQQSQSMEQQEQLVRDQEEQLSQLQEQVLHEIEEQLEKPRERSPDGEELPDSRALRKKLQINREEVAKQISAHKQQQSIRAEQQQRTIDRLGSQLKVLLDLLEQIRAKPVMKLSGRKSLQAEVLSTVKERQEWMEQLQETEIKQEQLYFEERKRLERYEETAEHWKLEQQALLKGQEMAEAAAREAERQAMEEAAKHLAEGKLVPGANLEVILTDPGPVGLAFYPDDSEPPRVKKVKKDRREFWDKQGMKDGAAILAVGDTPTSHMTSAELLPLLNGRPLRLQFALEAVGQGINGTDSGGQTALHRALEAGDEAAALDILANPDFKAINVQDNLGKTALHWAASSGLGDACKAILRHPDFRSEDAVDYKGSTAKEDAEVAGQMEVVQVFDNKDDLADDQEGW